MSYLELPDGQKLYPFGQGGGEETAQKYDVPLLSRIPLDEQVRAGGDLGMPAALSEDPVSKPFLAVATQVDKAVFEIKQTSLTPPRNRISPHVAVDGGHQTCYKGAAFWRIDVRKRTQKFRSWIGPDTCCTGFILRVCVLAWNGALGLKAIGLLFISVGCFFTGKKFCHRP